MSIVSVAEVWQGRTGAYNQKGVRTYQREWEVLCSSDLDGPLVATATGIPALYFPYVTLTESDYGAIVQGINVKNDEAVPWLWHVTVNYSSEPIRSPKDESPNQSNDSRQQPELRPWSFAWSSRKTEKPFVADANNRPVVNAAGIAFDPPAMIDVFHPVLKIGAWKSTFNIFKIKEYMGAVNADIWQGFAPRELKVTNFEAETNVDNGIKTWKVTLEVEVNFEYWNPIKILNAGTTEIYIKDGVLKWRQITDEHGQPITHPVPLDDLGAKLTPDALPIYYEWDAYREIEFKTII